MPNNYIPFWEATCEIALNMHICSLPLVIPTKYSKVVKEKNLKYARLNKFEFMFLPYELKPWFNP